MMSEDKTQTEVQASVANQGAGANERLASAGPRRILATIVTIGQRIQGYVSTDSDRLVDHLNQAYPEGAIVVDGARESLVDAREIIYAAPDDVAEPPAHHVQAWVKKSWETVHAGLGRYVVVGNIFLPASTSYSNAPLDPESLPPFVVMKNAVIHDLKALDVDERYEVLLVNSRRIDYIIRPL